ncbi:MAG: dTDP-4-dehydrorhamnose reductase [Leptospirillum sp.]|jgi:dTDP-4-dehydrorhamnose reductase
MRVGVIGSRGQLGKDLVQVLSGEAVPYDRPAFDVLDPSSWAILKDSPVDVLVNTSAYNEVDQAESDIESCFALNAFAPAQLAEFCEENKIIFITVSTDYVFGNPSSDPPRPFSELSEALPLSVYGVSKRSGEMLTLNRCPHSYVIRTCGLFGYASISRARGSFVETMLRLAQKGTPINVVSDQLVSPTPTYQLALALKKLIMTQPPFGIYHLTSAGFCSWYDFARKIFDLSGLSVVVNPTTMAEFRAKARRSFYTVLSNDKANENGIYLPSWEEGLSYYLANRKTV